MSRRKMIGKSAMAASLIPGFEVADVRACRVEETS